MKHISGITTTIVIVVTVYWHIIYRFLDKIAKPLLIARNENGLSGWVGLQIVVYNFETVLPRHTRRLRKLIGSSEVYPNNRAIGGERAPKIINLFVDMTLGTQVFIQRTNALINTDDWVSGWSYLFPTRYFCCITR